MSKGRKFDYNDLSSWGVIPLFLVSVVIVLVVLGLAYKLFITSKQNSLDSEYRNIESKQLIVARNINNVALLPEMRRQVEELKGTLEEAKRILPTNISMPSLIDDVYNSARNNGIVFSEFKPEEDIKQEFYTVKPIFLKSKVGFLSMANFIQEVTSLERIMNVERVIFNYSFENNSEIDTSSNQLLEMEAELRTYVFNEVDNGDR